MKHPEPHIKVRTGREVMPSQGAFSRAAPHLLINETGDLKMAVLERTSDPKSDDPIYEHVKRHIDAGELDPRDKVLGLLHLRVQKGVPLFILLHLHGDVRGREFGAEWYNNTIVPFLRERGFKYLIEVPGANDEVKQHWRRHGSMPLRKSKYYDEIKAKRLLFTDDNNVRELV